MFLIRAGKLSNPIVLSIFVHSYSCIGQVLSQITRLEDDLTVAYCGGLFAYAREVAARTEQYWCPIKHARKTLDPHRLYALFADFGQAEEYHELSSNLRTALRDEKD